MYIINPDPYLLPNFLISPFSTADISKNNELKEGSSIDTYFSERFGNKKFTYQANGRAAINKALAYYKLSKDDVVTILTTSGNFYISSCVTSEIEKFCQWSREITANTKVLFVNHEFGFPFEELEQLKTHKLPIIEDCAHSFFSKDSKSLIGKIGDFSIYSFPKIFPIQIGGLLVSNIANEYKTENDLNKAEEKYLKKVLSHYIRFEDKIKNKRIKNYNKLKKELLEFGFTERFVLKEHEIPGVYMFKVNNDLLDLDSLKSYLQLHGIHCSVFYGERSFFIPCHQNLTGSDIAYFKAIINSFLNKL